MEAKIIVNDYKKKKLRYVLCFISAYLTITFTTIIIITLPVLIVLPHEIGNKLEMNAGNSFHRQKFFDMVELQHRREHHRREM